MTWHSDPTEELIADLRRSLAEKDAELERIKTAITQDTQAYVALALRDEYIRAAEAWFAT